MSHFSHKPDYFLHAHLLANYLSNRIQKAGEITTLTMTGKEVYDLFDHDFASTTSDLEGIINITDNYHVAENSPEYKLIADYKIHAEHNTVTFNFNPKAVQALVQGQALLAPDANSYE
ncbi:hypothetical protein SAMN05421749_103395 [Acinetobacter marinus]|uniref:Uncharacterized protein n=1 Tax=Acinetobacter marinus TaxID=281375 RepID=A0A1G6JMW6_9GAMM|nr:hypothetical protein [Acinetobacter marinus]SDC19775.1 hypothetical protein SAMN05421749_103395 [Acinetobacter marinus]